MSHKILRPFIVKVSVLGYFPLYIFITSKIAICERSLHIYYLNMG